MLSPRLSNWLTPAVTSISRNLPNLGTKIVCHLHRAAVGHQLLTADHDGFKILIDPNDNCGGKLYYWGSYEPEQTQVFKQLLEELKPDSFLDIGTNIGYYSLMAATHSKAKVYSFEPSPRVADCLAQSIAMNGYGDQITPIRKAVGKERGTLTFFVNDNPHNFGIGSVVKTVAGSTEVTVECCSADEELSMDLGNSVLCKVDVEGAEFAALSGMQRILSTKHPTLIVEVHPLELRKLGSSSREVYDLLRSHNYELTTLESSNRAVEFSELPDDTNYWMLGR